MREGSIQLRSDEFIQIEGNLPGIIMISGLSRNNFRERKIVGFATGEIAKVANGDSPVVHVEWRKEIGFRESDCGIDSEVELVWSVRSKGQFEQRSVVNQSIHLVFESLRAKSCGGESRASAIEGFSKVRRKEVSKAVDTHI
jgi:hypothetical protein